MNFISISSHSPSPMSFSSSPVLEVGLDRKLEEYEEFIRRITDEERQDLEAQLYSLADAREFIPGLLSAIEGPWGIENPYIAHEAMPYYALLAFKEGEIENYQLGTLLKFWSAHQHHIEYYQDREEEIPPFVPRGYSLFQNNGMPNQDALELVFKTFYQSDDPADNQMITITDAEKWQWVDKMRLMPPSEQRFFIIPNLLEKRDVTDETISDLFDKQNYFIFRWIDQTKKKIVILPTIGMQQAFIEATHRGAGKIVTINPVIGVSSDTDIRKNGLEATRDMACHFPNIALPDEADRAYAPWHYFTDHDAFHAKRADDIGTMRVSIIRIADALGLDGTKQEKKIQNSVKNCLIDMDFPTFRIRDFNKGERFWVTFGVAFHSGARTFSELSPKTEDKVLERIYDLISKNLTIFKCLTDRFKSLKEKICRISPEETDTFKKRTFKRLIEIWKIRNFKTLFLEKKGKFGKEKLIKKLFPLINEENVHEFLKFSISQGGQAMLLEKYCIRFLTVPQKMSSLSS